MSDYDLTAGGTTKMQSRLTGNTFLYQIRLNFADIIADNTVLAAAGKIAQNDVLQVMDVPARTLIKRAWLEIGTLSGSAATCDLGDDAQVDNLIDGADLSGAAGTITKTVIGDAGSVAAADGKMYTATDTLDLAILGADITTANGGEINLFIEGTQLPDYDAKPTLVDE